LVEVVFGSFKEYAAAHEVKYRLTMPAEKVSCWFDERQLRKVFFNLLSNAFKHTPDGGSIEVLLAADAERIAVKVIDSGNGIARADLPKVFDRFYQADNRLHDFDKLTGGIGLALCKDIVELHRGTIQVLSSPGTGSIFTVTLLRGSDHFTADELSAEGAVITDLDIEPFVPVDEGEEQLDLPETSATDADDDVRPVVLLVEDNAELLASLHTLFAANYRVLLASDGEEGFDLAKREKPDLIVSDVMMPRLTGDVMCARLKDRFDTCHIPIVLLTALGAEEQVAEGYRNGADAYISKPFSTKVLLACCDNLLRSRYLIQLHEESIAAPAEPSASSAAASGSGDASAVASEAAATSAPAAPSSPVAVSDSAVGDESADAVADGSSSAVAADSAGVSGSSAVGGAPSAVSGEPLIGRDLEFLREVDKVVERHVDDSEFDINVMARELGLSRSSLYNKFRESTTLTPNDYVLRYRLRRAAQRLKAEPELQVTEIADLLGFGSSRYFTRCFKALYGMTPSEYRKA
jgi:CheY-like chemotaxis protein/anti-sigma regulatory factor (Ser/Thr protein kinase)